MIRNDVEAADAFKDAMHPDLEPCSIAAHEVMKLDGSLLSLKPVGRMPTYDEPGQPQTLVLYNCPNCDSTLAVEV